MKNPETEAERAARRAAQFQEDRPAIAAVAQALLNFLRQIDPPAHIGVSAAAGLLAVAIAGGAKDDAASERILAEVLDQLPKMVRVNRALRNPGPLATTTEVGHG